MVRKIILWALVIGCMIMIFSFSAQESAESDTVSRSFLSVILRVFGIDAESGNAQMWNVLLRKTAHFSVYALLGILVSILMRAGYGMHGKWAVLIPVIWVFLYAVSDEVHQLFVAGRSGQFTDVCLDSTGGFTGTLLIWIIARMKNDRFTFTPFV